MLLEAINKKVVEKDNSKKDSNSNNVNFKVNIDTQKAMKTTKKVKVVGHQEYINNLTGEIEEFQVVRLEDRDFNFHKVWLEHVISSLDLIGNQKTKLAFWILNNLDKENKLCMTYRQISQYSGISYQTVSATMTKLIESDFLQRINQGSYRVNPNVIFKGTHNGRLNVLYQYNNSCN